MGVPMTVATIVTKVQTEVQDTAGDYATTAMIQGFVNDGMAEWCERVRARRAWTTINVTAEDPTVDLSGVTPPVLEVLNVYLPKEENGTDVYELPFVTVDWLSKQHATWLTDDADIPRYYTRESEGFQSLRLYPKPETAYSSFALSGGQVSYDSLFGMEEQSTGLNDSDFDSLYGAGTAASLKFGGCQILYMAGGSSYSATSQTPYDVCGIPVEYHEAIFFYCTYRFLMAETDLKQVERAAIYKGLFDEAIERASGQTKRGFQTNPTRSVAFRNF